MAMKLMLVVLALATAATAQVFLPGSATMVDAFPRSMPTPQGQIDMATAEQWLEAGGRYATAKEIASDKAAKDADAKAQAEAEQVEVSEKAALKAEAKAAKNEKEQIAVLMKAVFGKDAQ